MLIDRDIAVPSRVETEGQQRIPFWFLSPEETGGIGNTDPVGQRVLVFRHPEYLLDIVPPLSLRKLYSVKAPPAAEKSPAAQKQNEAHKESGDAAAQTGGQKKLDDKKAAPEQTPATGNQTAAAQGNTSLQPGEKAKLATAAEPRAKNDTISMGVRVLRAIIMEILLKRQDAGILIPISEEESWLKFPDAFKDMGMKPIEVLGILNDEHLVIPSPESPEKLTQKKTIPGINKEQNVVVLSPLALQKIPCLKMQLAMFPKEHQVTYHRFLLEHAKECPEAKFSAEKTTKKGYWFIPIEWVVENLRQHFKDDSCPERFLRECAIGPGSEEGGLVLRLPNDLENGVDA
jgi:conjugal transfer pilus assembly protein TraI